MNTPNPLVPQGTFADKGKNQVRLTVFAILAVHVLLLGVLLIAGCDKKDPNTAGTDPGLPPTPQALPPVDPTWPPTPAPAPTTGLVATTSTSTPPVGLAPAGTPGSLTPPPPVNNTFVEPPPAPSASEHTVVRGDSFSVLAKQYKVSSRAIADANPGVDSARLKIGQKLNIPAPKAPSAAAPAGGASAPAASNGDAVHTVKSGDNLWTLSRKYGVTERELRSANNLRTSRLTVGQKLKIPSKAPPAAPPEATPPPAPPPPSGTAPSGFAPVGNP